MNLRVIILKMSKASVSTYLFGIGQKSFAWNINWSCASAAKKKGVLFSIIFLYIGFC